jgi:hypothetical protein
VARKSYIQINGVLYDKAELQGMEGASSVGAPAIIADTAAFVSPIDGSVVDGRAALRDHCARHNVVPTVELKGLPPKPFVNTEFSREHREGTKRVIAEIINSRNYK